MRVCRQKEGKCGDVPRTKQPAIIRLSYKFSRSEWDKIGTEGPCGRLFERDCLQLKNCLYNVSLTSQLSIS